MTLQKPNREDVWKQPGFDDWFRWTLALAVYASRPFILWLRVPGRIGERFIGIPTIVGTFLSGVVVEMHVKEHAPIFIYAQFAMLTVHFMAMLTSDREVHSSYDGVSIPQLIVERITGKPCDEFDAKASWDFFALMLAAAIAAPISDGLAICLFFAAVGWEFDCIVFYFQNAAILRTRKDMRLEYSSITGKRPLATSPKAAPGEKHSRKFAKLVLIIATVLLALGAVTGQLGDFFRRLPLPSFSFSQVEPDRPAWMVVREREAEAKAKRDAQLRKWRQYNARNGFY